VEQKQAAIHKDVSWEMLMSSALFTHNKHTRRHENFQNRENPIFLRREIQLSNLNWLAQKLMKNSWK
jgi:hypothetical protein